MNKGNSYRKLYYIDRFARAYYCRHARENQLRMDKKMAKKAARHNRKTIQDFELEAGYGA